MKPTENKVRIQPWRTETTRPSAAPPARSAAPTGSRRSSIMKRVVVVGALGCALVLLGFQLIQLPGGTPDYKTEKVKRDTLIREVIASGPLVPALKAEIDSLVAGTALAVHADFGSEVESGQPLAQIDPATANLSLKEAENGLRSARALVQVARTRADQCKTLMKQGLLPKTDYDKAMSDLKQAEGNADIAESNVSRAQIAVERCTIRSPLKGVVIARNVTVGQSVDTGNGTLPLFVVASDLSKMQIEANVAESDIGGVRQEMEAAFTVDAFPDKTFKGRVAQVRPAPVVDQTVVNYQVIIETNNEDLQLKPGMTANVTIVVAHHEDVLTIPNKALRFRPADNLVAASKKPKDKDSRDKGSDKGSLDKSSDKDPLGKGPDKVADEGSKDVDDGGKKATSAAADDDGAKKVPSVAGGDGEAATVYRLSKRAGSLEKVAIRTGFTDGKQTEVIEGLKEGDRLVVGLDKPDDKKSGLFSLPDILSGGTGKKKGP